jgi:hypothetical protein
LSISSRPRKSFSSNSRRRFRPNFRPVNHRATTTDSYIMVCFLKGSWSVLFGLISWSQLVDAQFFIYDDSTLLDTTLGEECRTALTAQIDCTPYAQTFQQLSYRGDLDVDLTNAICTADCLSSLKSWFESVSTKCVGKSVSGGIPTRYGGYIYQGYNETCIKDPRPPRAYCNSTFVD